MSYSSDKVKRWRERTKRRIVEAMGGGCIICNYAKSLRALDLHHLNAEEKEFGFGRIMANPRSWKKLVPELRKCVLVCCRCHAEIHDGMTDIPVGCARFNEEYMSYNDSKVETDTCPVCQGPKYVFNKTCSRNCAATLSRKVKWDDIDLKSLLEQNMSYRKIGDILNVSGTAVKKRAKKLGLLSS